jgi:hypothetical protein
MKKTREILRTSHDDAKNVGGRAGPRARRDAREAEAAEVRYFLHALHQMSLALHALGYAAEGAALVKVNVDLNSRLFLPSGKIAEATPRLN